ncbi:MAG: NAD-dependent epimerase/dehydratase family protein [Candidatus Omnitrophica bacterium]|nr:NAD-dependent epimerase/dehydratase family protein [Candidatus Omnitrophota bacterium]
MAVNLIAAVKTFWRDRRVLVTGGTGLLGGWLIRALYDLGADCVTLLRDWVPQSELCQSGLLERIKVVRGELQDQALLERVLGEYEVQTLFHLAAQAIVPIANRNPVSTFESNIRGTWCLLEACRRSPTVGQAVVASSDKAYGEHDKLPYREETPLRGRHPYDVSKSCADLLAQSYAATYRLPVTIARCGNLYGGGDLNWNRIVPGTIRSAIRGEPPLIRSDGSPTRDYFYVEDGAAAYLALAEALASDPSLAGEAFNFSNEQPLSVLEVARQILRLMGRADLAPKILNESSGEILHQYLDAGKAKRQLSWKSLYGLEEGLKKTISWYRKFLEGADRPRVTPEGVRLFND